MMPPPDFLNFNIHPSLYGVTVLCTAYAVFLVWRNIRDLRPAKTIIISGVRNGLSYIQTVDRKSYLDRPIPGTQVVRWF